MDNLDRLLEAVEHPERFSESELQALLSDPEARQLYRLICASRAEAFTSGSVSDDSEIDRQWEAFRSARRKRPVFFWFSQRKAAAVVALLIASCSIIMVGVSLSRSSVHDGRKSEQPITEQTIPADEGLRMIPTVNDTIIVFEDETLDRILDRIASYYNAKVSLTKPASSEVRLFLKWDSTMELPELIEHLNSFERINLFLKDDTITDY